MSLAGFHLFFITISFLMSVGVGVWGVRTFMQEGGVSSLVIGIFCFVFAVVLVPYGIKVRRKLHAIEDEE